MLKIDADFSVPCITVTDTKSGEVTVFKEYFVFTEYSLKRFRFKGFGEIHNTIEFNLLNEVFSSDNVKNLNTKPDNNKVDDDFFDATFLLLGAELDKEAPEEHKEFAQKILDILNTDAKLEAVKNIFEKKGD